MTKPSRVALAALASFVLASTALTGAAQGSTSLVRLELRLARAPEDPRLLCEVGWARFVADRGDAIQALERGIAALGEPSERDARRRLAACLESRGRVAEHRRVWAEAVTFYERSLALRPSSAVSARARSVRELLAAGWTRSALHTRRDAIAAPADIMAVLDAGRASIVARWGSTAGDEVVLVAHERAPVARAVLLARRAGGPWIRLELDEYVAGAGEETFALSPIPGARGVAFEVLHTWEARVGDGEYDGGEVRKVITFDGTRLRLTRS